LTEGVTSVRPRVEVLLMSFARPVHARSFHRLFVFLRK
jgi:hypothetical protein